MDPFPDTAPRFSARSTGALPMLSRVADSIYWMARYMERAENLARLLLVNQHIMLDSAPGDASEEAFWEPLLVSTGEDATYRRLHRKVGGATVGDFLTVSPDNPNSIRNCVATSRENARMIRDQLSDELWMAINDLHLFLRSPRGERLRQHAPTDYLEEVLRASYLFQGIARSTLIRGKGWLFLQMGTYLERADKTSRLVDTASDIPLVSPPHPEAKPLRWASLLHSCSAYGSFHEMSNRLEPRDILEFLFLSPEFPRSVRFCCREVDRALRELRGPLEAAEARDPRREAGRLRADLDFATMEEIVAEGIHTFIDRLQKRLNALGEDIFETFVLYADRLPVDPPVPTPLPAGAWHPGSDEAEQQQQQQQQ